MSSAGSGGRRGEAARTCPCPSRRPRPLGRAQRRRPPPPSERLVRRQHDFCLQAGFPPGHDGRGAPARAGPHVSGVPRERVVARAFSPRPRPGGLCQVALRVPEEGEAGAAAPLPGKREWGLGIGRRLWAPEPALGWGRRESVLTGRAARRRGSGIGFGGPARQARGERPAGRGVPGWRARVHARATGTAGLWELGWPFLPDDPLFPLSICKDSSPVVGEGEERRGKKERKKKGRGRLIIKHDNSQVCCVAEISGNFYVIVVVLSGIQPII